MPSQCTYIDGIASSQAIDTAGEIVDIMGLDCSMLIGGAFNWEHKSDLPAQLVGKVLEFKKIFTKDDCETDRQRHYWNKINMPFLYVLGRLFDDDPDKASSKEVAALFRDDAAHPNEPKMVGFSIEGAKVNKEGMTITRSIARKVTITNASANKTCEANLVPAKRSSSKEDSIFKGEIEFFSPNDKYLEILKKKEEEMEKDVGTGGGTFIGDSMAMSELAKSMTSWRHTGGGNFQHPEHGIVSIVKQPSGEFHVKHNGAMAGLNGMSGAFKSPTDAGMHAGNYMRSVSENKVIPKLAHPAQPSLGKSLDAGSGMAAPGQLVGAAALGKESLMGKKKSKWLARAEEAYKVWEKREQFESFMKSKMPHLTKGEIIAIGQTLALKKSIEAESSLSKMFADHLENGKKTTS